MRSLKTLVYISIVITSLSCKEDTNYPYAIKDFRKTLQPALAGLVNSGVVNYGDDYDFLKRNATQEELRKLTNCEHPILRAEALFIITLKDTIDNFALVMGHLDDTARVLVDVGEFGYQTYMVTDYLLQNSIWKTQAEHDITLDTVIMQHNYLSSAYNRLRRIPKTEKYYPFIRQMALRQTSSDNLQAAAIQLGEYGRPEDIPVIKNIFEDNILDLNEESFFFISHHTDTAYFNILKTYSRRPLSWSIKKLSNPDYEYAFLQALASFKNKESAAILKRMLDYPPFLWTNKFSASFKGMLVNVVWDNKCDAYAGLINEIKPMIAKPVTDGAVTLPVDPGPVIPEKMRW